MVTPGERRALLFFAAVLALGAGTRTVHARRVAADPVAQAELAAHMQRVDSARRAARDRRRGGGGGARGRRARAKPKADSLASPVDLDRASAAEIEALPGIGPVVAARIVAYRDSAGAIGSLEALQRVKGVGPRLAAQIERHVTFSSAH